MPKDGVSCEEALKAFEKGEVACDDRSTLMKVLMCNSRALQAKGEDPSSSMKNSWKKVREKCPKRS